jgi:nucleotide-binding universal stress UspA family protein
MTKLILVPLDGSPFGARALSLAASLARRNGAELHLVHVHDRPVQLLGAPANDLRFDREMEELMGSELTALAESLRTQTHLPITSAVLEGPVGATLVQHIDATRPWLVVMSSHGRGGMRRMAAGNVADALARHAGVPILIERWANGATSAEQPTNEPVFRNILLPLDGSDLADDIVDYAAQLGEPGQTTFTLLRVVVPTPDFAPPSPAPPMPVANVDVEHSRSEALTYFSRVAYTLKQRGFLAMPEVVVDPQPAEAILAFAAKHPTDLIALSTHGHGGFTRVVLGSVADRVVRRADIAVLLHGPTHAVAKQDGGVLSGAAHR